MRAYPVTICRSLLLRNSKTYRTSTQAGFTAYSEGWGLYSEVLAREIPAYVDPYNRFGQLTSKSGAIRLVVDTGLHAKGWTEQQAIDYFMQNSPEPLESVRSEIQRYMLCLAKPPVIRLVC